MYQSKKRFLPLMVIFLLLLGWHTAGAMNDEVINVATAGLVPNSGVNQSAAFQALLRLHGDHTTYYFPAGVYLLSDITLVGAKHLTFQGDNAYTVWQYINPPSSYVFMLTCTDCEDITFRNFTVDNRHIFRYGGLRFYHSMRMAFTRMAFIDSWPRPNPTTDLYGVVFGRGDRPSDTITVTDSFFYRLNLEVDHAHNVTVQRNTFQSTWSTAAIGAFSIVAGTEALNWLVEDNYIIHPERCAICFNLDPPSTNNTIWRHLRVRNNTIERVSGGRYNIRFGTGNTSVRVTGTVFDDIVTEGNTVRYIGLAQDRPLVQLSGYPSYGITFTNTHLEDMP